MLEKFRHYHLIAELSRKYSHSTYLASMVDEPENQVVLTIFAASLFRSPQECEDLLQRARRLKELEHPHLVPILDLGIEEEQPFVMRQYLPNGSLRNRLKQLASGRMELQDALTLILQVGEALAYAHQCGVVHGNIKPENILFDTDGQPILTDFYLMGRKDALIRDQTTQEYAFCYLAPEQFASTSSAKGDQYALGCLTYELITGQVPFAARSLASMMAQSSDALPTPLSEIVPDLPSLLETAVRRTLYNDPAKRFFHLSLFLGVIKSVLAPVPAFPLVSSGPLHEKSSIAHSSPQLEDLSTSPIREMVEGEEHMDTPPAHQISMLEWAGIVPISESLEAALACDQLTSALSWDATAFESENREAITSFEQEGTGASLMLAPIELFDEYSASAVTEEIVPVRKSASAVTEEIVPVRKSPEIAVPWKTIYLYGKKRGLEIALLLSLIVGAICSALWLPGRVTPDSNSHMLRPTMHTVEKIVQVGTAQVMSTSIVQQPSPPAIKATAPLSTQVAAQPTVLVTSTPTISVQSASVGPTPTTAPTTTAPTTTSYEAEASQNTLSGKASAVNCSGCSGGKKVGHVGQGSTLQFNNVSEASAGSYRLTIYYINGGTDRSLLMSVNGGGAVNLTFHGTNDGNWSTPYPLSVTVSLNAGNNTIEFSNSSTYGPDIDRIVV